ncbi:MAG: RNA polymerase sigma factor [Bacteroidetes bacterium]|nr:RNA polymerase sigma factor [Bacteroidota bacterium]MBU1116872.1 RNA polymerase sigma factor [Bacteroidota bacterium]MBU1797450.1 RNA polymerase sigma factor [Bacteroidota bacterium]
MTKSSNNIVQFTISYNHYKDGVYNYILKMVGNRMVCDDLVQNVFLKLFENLDSIKNKESIKFWIYTTARNEVYGYFRKKKIDITKFVSEDSSDVKVNSKENLEYQFELKEMKKLILKELEHISIEQKEIFLLKEYGGLSYKEISVISNISEDLVKSRLYKTRQKLISKLAKMIK